VADGSGSASFTVTLPAALPGGFVTATATALAGSGTALVPTATSEFSATSSVAAMTDVDVSQTVDRAGVNAGDAAGFTVTILNEGPGDAKGLTLSDPLPAGLGSDIAWQIDPGSADAASFQITGAVGSQVLALRPGVTTLAAGQALTVRVTGATSGNDADATTFQGTLTNTPTVNATNEVAAEQNDQATATITINAPDVDVSESADRAGVTAGDPAGFTVTLRNEGAGDAVGVTLTDPLPGGLGRDVAWQIDGGTGTPPAFQLSGAVGSQVLSLAGANGTLAAGARLTVHLTGVTTAAAADPTTLAGMLPVTATVNAGNEAAAEQNDQAGGNITVAAPSHSPLAKGQTATIGFWHNKNGQAVISNFNGGPTAMALGNWLAANFGNLFGGLAGQTNAQVARAYQTAFANAGGVQGNAYAQAFALALAVYTTTSSLGGASTAANPATAHFGFQITAAGAGAATYNAGTSGAALGVPNGTTLTVLRILQIANQNFSLRTGLFYQGDSTKTSALDNLLDAINQAGDISS
jgi:uncharacterized repeat protein (TIGR01451 family)